MTFTPDYINGTLDPQTPSGKGTIMEYVVLTVMGDCIKEKFNYDFDLTSIRLNEINVKSSERHDSKNGKSWFFGKNPNSYLPDYYVCVGLDDASKNIIHVWEIPGDARVVGSCGIRVLNTQKGLNRVKKYEVDPTPYNETYQNIDIRGFPEFQNIDTVNIKQNKSIAMDIRNELSIKELESIYGGGCYQQFLDWVENNKLKQYFSFKTGMIGLYPGGCFVELKDNNYPVFNYRGRFLGNVKSGGYIHHECSSNNKGTAPENYISKVKLIRSIVREYSKNQRNITLEQIKQETGIENPSSVLDGLCRMGDILQLKNGEYKYV